MHPLKKFDIMSGNEERKGEISMNESYGEYLVSKKKRPVDSALKIILTVITILFVFAGFLHILFLIGAVLAGIANYLYSRNVDLEYEYLYVDKELTIDKIMNKQARKHVKTLELSKMEVLVKEKSHEVEGYRRRIKKTYDFSSGASETEKYVMMYNEEGDIVQILLEMDEHMLNCIKAVFPRQVNIEK